MANEGLTKPMVNGFCEKHQPNQAVQYAGCWVCSREEETALIEQFLNALGWGHDEEAEENLGGEWWSRAGEEDGAWKTADAAAKALDDYDSLREAHKKAHLYGASQEAELLRVRGLLQRYGKHDVDCRVPTRPCSCGYAQVIASGAESEDIGKLDAADKRKL